MFCILFLLLTTSLTTADPKITGFTVGTSLERLEDLKFSGHNFYLNGNLYEGDFTITLMENGHVETIFSTKVENGRFEETFPLCEIIEITDEDEVEEDPELAVIMGYVYQICDGSETGLVDILGPAIDLFSGGEIDIANMEVNFRLDDSNMGNSGEDSDGHWGSAPPNERISTVIFESGEDSITGDIDEVNFDIVEDGDTRLVNVDIMLINIRHYLRPKVTRHVYGIGHVADVTNGEVTYYHQDRVGSTRLATDEEGEVVGEFKSLPFGQEIINDDIRYSFATGKELDSSNLYYFGARYYDPNIGRFTSVDPVKDNHAYSYVNNNPMNYVDPNGMDDEGVDENFRTLLANEMQVSPDEIIITPEGHFYFFQNPDGTRVTVEGDFKKDITIPIPGFGNLEVGSVGGDGVYQNYHERYLGTETIIQRFSFNPDSGGVERSMFVFEDGDGISDTLHYGGKLANWPDYTWSERIQRGVTALTTRFTLPVTMGVSVDRNIGNPIDSARVMDPISSSTTLGDLMLRFGGNPVDISLKPKFKPDLKLNE